MMDDVLDGFLRLKRVEHHAQGTEQESGRGKFALRSEIPDPDVKDSPNKVTLPIQGQGVVAFELQKSDVRDFTIQLWGRKPDVSKSSPQGAESVLYVLTVTDDKLKLTWRDSKNRVMEATRQLKEERKPYDPAHLIHFKNSSQYLWVSVDKKSETIRVGHGYMMRRNTLLKVVVKDEEPLKDKAGQPLRMIAGVTCVSIPPDRLSPDRLGTTKVNGLPVVTDAPPVVVPNDALTLLDIGRNTALPAGVLPSEAQRLYATVGGQGISLSEEDTAAINHSIVTPGKKLHQKVLEKWGGSKRRAEEKGTPIPDVRSTYLRITLGEDEGNSPGAPFVLELWPPDHYSSIHEHSNSVAIIKVLHGTINVSNYNPLANENHDEPVPIGEATYHAGNVTWLTPEMYQTHKLHNPDKSRVCATLQCYKYLDRDGLHYETFDYVSPGDAHKHHFEPSTDIPFLEMLKIVREEWRTAQLEVAPDDCAASRIVLG